MQSKTLGPGPEKIKEIQSRIEKVFIFTSCYLTTLKGLSGQRLATHAFLEATKKRS